MAQLFRSVVALRVIGDDLIPDEISSLLGSEPTTSQRMGDRLLMKSGERIAKFGMWMLSATDQEPEAVDAQVAEILAKLTRDFAVWHSLAARFQVNIFCGWFMEESNEGLSLLPKTLLMLGERHIELDIDIYGPSTAAS